MKTRIINLVGASGTGKTYIAKKLSELDNINVIKSYTTRPPRHENEWGHMFIEEYTVHEVPRKDRVIVNDITHTTLHRDGDMIAYFNSYNSRHHYFATDEQVVRGKTNIYVVDPEGAKQVHKFYEGTDVEVITIGIYEDKDKLSRNLEKREGLDLKDIILEDKYGWEKSDKYKEYQEKVAGRINKDEDLFKIIKCDYMIKGSDNALEVIKEMMK